MENSWLQTQIEYLKGVGPAKAELLKKEAGIYTFGDLLFYFPFRYVDRTKFYQIADIRPGMEDIQVKGTLRSLTVIGQGRKKRLVGQLQDDSGTLELVWFRGVKWIKDSLKTGQTYIAYGRVNFFRNRPNLPHPEMELFSVNKAKKKNSFYPVYSSTEKLSAKGLNTRGFSKIMAALMDQFKPEITPEILPPSVMERLRLMGRFDALRAIHFPRNKEDLQASRHRLKFEELFFLQLHMLKQKLERDAKIKGYVFDEIGEHFNDFFNKNLAFELTGAQKRVLKEIRKDLRLGVQMNRLLQGDVGSGKTVVALMSMLIALGNGYQTCMVAPTEILAQQHYQSITEMVAGLGIRVAFLSGSVKGKRRKELLKWLAEGELDILIGTHAVLEKPVVFKSLGLAITDEQHRFGVAQRAKLWHKSTPYPPHILVMTATPIPRTLAMTIYGDLDVSVIDELPPGRKPVQTLHATESQRLKVFGLIRKEIDHGRQVYIVYPLIEESATLDLKNLEEGYENIRREFPPPQYQISVVHGKMKAEEKDLEMQRFVERQTQIMVATTVIEVGVNVPNASIMLIENTERFGLSQLHQLRGRVGRGADQSYCILMSGDNPSRDARERIRIMTDTNDGFKIAEADLRLRGPGEISGTQQSGIEKFKLADLGQDQQLIKTARAAAQFVLQEDPDLKKSQNSATFRFLEKYRKKRKAWSRIS